ncbi:classical arabinogalactan protein 7-like, partial [Penaeus japonicus]|uniref:classical arabinogalactan protein 7-like n=1 Tax=Penaeus japonicus TaxID=27405 RepID=UPI001C7171C4
PAPTPAPNTCPHHPPPTPAPITRPQHPPPTPAPNTRPQHPPPTPAPNTRPQRQPPSPAPNLPPTPAPNTRTQRQPPPPPAAAMRLRTQELRAAVVTSLLSLVVFASASKYVVTEEDEHGYVARPSAAQGDEPVTKGPLEVATESQEEIDKTCDCFKEYQIKCFDRMK